MKNKQTYNFVAPKGFKRTNWVKYLSNNVRRTVWKKRGAYYFKASWGWVKIAKSAQDFGRARKHQFMYGIYER